MKREIQISEGTLVQPALHDGHLTGVSAAGEDSISLVATDTKGDRYDFLLTGVVRFRATDFLQSNTILDITIETGAAVARDEVVALFGLQNHPAFAAFLDGVMAKLNAGELRLLRINPTYGCSVACLCAAVELKGA